MTDATLTNHFHRNSRLFTALGVFGAISVYFTQLQLESRWRRLGIVSSLSIFILVALTIQRNLPPDSSDSEPFDYIIDALPRKPGHLVFYVCLWFLVVSVSAIIVRFSDTLLFLVQFFVFLGGFAAARRLVIEIDRSFEKHYSEDVEITLGEGAFPIVYALHIIRNALYAVILGGGTLFYAWWWNLLIWEQLVSFQVPSLLSAVVVGFASGVAVGGIAFTLIAISIIWLHYIFIWIKDQGIEEEFAQYMRRYWGVSESQEG